MAVKSGYKVLRLFSSGSETGDDWHERAHAYSANEIKEIKDPEGAKANRAITSIPSPFARLHLFDQAFQYVVDAAHSKQKNALDGDTIYHKLVSDALDVGEMFFKFDVFKQRRNLEIRTWNRSKGVEALKSSTIEGHKLLGETLDLFIKQDGPKSHLTKVKDLHFIYCDFKLVGGTSPTTLFFAGGNDLSHVDLRSGDDTLFDQSYCPLFRRGRLYQRYLYGLFTAHRSLREEMPLFWKYLEASLTALEGVDKPFYFDLNKITEAGEYTLDVFQSEFEKWAGTQAVTIWDEIQHLKQKEDDPNRLAKSDFLLAASRNTEAKPMPMALQKGLKLTHLEYYHGKWDADYDVPYVADHPIEKRFLPGQDVQYPYYVVSDLLEPVLVELSFALDEKRFF